MRRSVLTGAFVALAAAFGTTLLAQKTTPVHKGKGGTPHVKSEWTIDGANISIEYGRPRTVFLAPGVSVSAPHGRAVITASAARPGGWDRRCSAASR